jgi:hypothetical protein
MKQENVDINLGSKFDAKGFKQAETALGKLSKSVKNVAGALGLAYGTRAVAKFGIASAKAFAADDKAARTLSRSLDNLGLAFADPAVKTFIGDLEKQFGVLDDQLRPAFQRLLTTVGSVSEAQSLLRTALDLSAASGADVVSVAGDLSKGYVGQTRALAKYGIGLTQAQLKAMSFEEVQTRINDLFGGQAQLSADSYAGALQRLAVASNNAKEIIGGGLLDALANLGGGGEGGLQNTLMLIEKTSTALATFIRKFGLAAGVTGQLFRGNIGGANALIAAEKNRGKDTSGLTPSIKAELAKAAADKAAAKRAKEQAVLTKKNTAAIKEQTALQKAGTLFDIESAGVIAALKGKITDEERTRLELQLAILTGNTTEASKLAGQLAVAQGLTQSLVKYYQGLPDAKNPFSGWITTLLNAQQLASTISAGNYNAVPMSVAAIAGTTSAQYSIPQASQITSAAGVEVTVNVNAGTVIAEEGLKDVIRDSLLNDSLQAKFAAIFRQGGSFAS